MHTERIETVVVGGGQAGLATGYHLARTGRPFVILDAGERVGDAWRGRWDSLRLFSPAKFDGLPGLPYPGPAWSFPTRDEYADYLQAYAAWAELPVRTGVSVRRVSYEGGRYVVETETAQGARTYEADNVVVAAGYDRLPKTPSFAGELAPDITQLHAVDYRNPDQLCDGPVLIVGAGNSGADISLELARTHSVLLSGPHPGQIPWRIEHRKARVLTPALFFAFRHLITVRTPMGRKLRPKVLAHSAPLIRVKPADLKAAGVRRVARTSGVREGRPVLADGSAPDVANVVWCTGFRPDISWIDLPGANVFDEDGEPAQRRGVVETQPGLYFVGRLFQYAMASSMIQGVGRDAEFVVRHLAARSLPARAEQRTAGQGTAGQSSAALGGGRNGA
ncbi:MULTISPECIES: flavin-containing monooxygenase [unclassified Streptomyces]|uniref:flavin-containing monooxygenase n=1 Tax=unclassified Streptomyces TaxID=2593676 RepID=UPI00225B21F1|nr:MULTISPECIES: NAD(P)-binding domain-containing protein [unclassified Streptomyces]MCX5047837.1 NAD(P)/FAD-dependent oxidoreductase [Streptomyces sp. NBC_00474]MCX5057460.1 NAD(P)/FAD-dependent oxidoreductase [Streptomyces sp. NBC_00452]MCX5245665.1 NAD(P)/FAD-dependent oxidoreductase [Streptomyces sp. NBC_00201]MCX5288534.1 NAD(P)/FAD-dependent oxidoreductase [Streptomyces sp. NBC_00183]